MIHDPIMWCGVYSTHRPGPDKPWKNISWTCKNCGAWFNDIVYDNEPMDMNGTRIGNLLIHHDIDSDCEVELVKRVMTS